MADFDIEFEKIILTEGGYVNDPDDKGGETYLGISRKYNPNLQMWKTIDSIKKQFGTKNINKRLKNNESIIREVKFVYKDEYWDPMCLDAVPSQDIAHELFDTAVNCGVKQAIRIIQHVIGMTVTGEFSNELLINLKRYGKN